MNAGSLVLFFFLPFYVNNSLAAYIAHLLAGRRMEYRKVFTLQIPLTIMQSVVYMIFVAVPNPSSELLRFFALSLWRISEIIILTIWVYYLFRDMAIKRRLFYVFAVFPFCILSGNVSNALRNVIFPGIMRQYYYEIPWAVYITYIGSFLFLNGMLAFIVRLISKTNFWYKLQSFADYPKLYLPLGIAYFLFYYAIFFVDNSKVSFYFTIINISSPVLLVLFGLLAGDIKKAESFKATQNLLLQQQNYINKLESIQQEIRGIQHDYKNMLAGLYAHASEGNAEAVREYIDTKLLKMDETVREDLRQMNQLTNIQIPELKGLIMTKMLEAERDMVFFRLEVMFPVKMASITTQDLLRCVGILLDNAIEEARNQEDAAVTLLLLQEDETLTIVVKNSVQDKPDLARIWDAGYSTKGSGRGVGLFNYQNIIRKYPNATQETKIESECFIQVLVLPNKKTKQQ